MGLFRFLFKTWWRIAISVVLGIIALGVLFGVVVLILANVGGPGPCTPGGGPISVSAANASAFDQKWDAFNTVLDSGSPSSVTFSESEITSRADNFIEGKSDVVKDIRVCIHDGFGEITGTLHGFLGIDVKFGAEGEVHLTSDHPEAELTDTDIGNVPAWILDPFENLLEDAIEELLDDIDLEHTYTLTLTEGQAQIDGVP